MTAKIANVIAVELGILIAVLSWLAFSEFSKLKSPVVAEDLRAPESSFATIRPVPRAPGYQPNAANYPATQPQPLLAGSQPLAQPNQALQYGTLDYNQPAATTPYTVIDDSPSDTTPYYDPYYNGGYQQPTIPYPDDYYYSPNDYGYYPSPGQIIVISNSGERARNCFSHRNPPMQMAPRHFPGGQFRPGGHSGGGRDTHSPGGLIAPRRSGGGGGGGLSGSHGTLAKGGGGAHTSRSGTSTLPR